MTEYAYSALDLVSEIDYNGGKNAQFAYNKTGNLVRMDDWNGTTSFELDLLGQLKKVTDHKGNTVSYTYDEVGNQTTVTYPDGGVAENTYDAVYNLTQVKDPENEVHKYTYDDARRNTKLEYPNGWVEDYTYDAEGQLLKVVDTDPFQTFNKVPTLKFEYQYDAEGNMTYAYKRDTGDSDLKSTTTYTYDALNRLTSSKTSFPAYPNGSKSQSYAYDTLGNLVREVGPTEKDVDTYQYTSLNQVVHKQECGYVQKITRIHNFGYAYDKRGNLTDQWEICSPTTQGPQNIPVANYVYDETNRMVQGTNKDGEVSIYTYNGLGVRVGTEQIVKDNTHGYTDFHCETPSVETGIDKPEVVKTDYLIDYTRIGIDQRLLWKSEEGGYDYRYVYGLDALSVRVTGEGTDWWGQKIQKKVVKEFYHTDVRGSLVNMTDGYGRVSMRADYDDWGDLQHSDSITINGGFRQLYLLDNYTGHEYDQVLELYYAKFRFYDPAERRFVAEDPVKDGSNWFVYCADNPMTWVDLLGLFLPGTLMVEGAEGNDVADLHEALYINGFPADLEKGALIFTAQTKKAVQKFQRQYNSKHRKYGQILRTDGKVDADTWTALGLRLNSTLQEEFNLPNKITAKFFDVLVCGNNFTINYHPSIAIVGAAHMGNTIWIDPVDGTQHEMPQKQYDNVSSLLQAKYLKLFTDGIEEIFGAKIDSNEEISLPPQVLGVNFSMKVNVNPIQVTSPDEADVVISTVADRSHVSHSWTGWSLNSPGKMYLYTKEWEPGSNGKDRGDLSFRRTVAHEFGHQVFGLGDAYRDDNAQTIRDIYPMGKEITKISLMKQPYYATSELTSNDIEMILWAYSTNHQQEYTKIGLSQAFYR